VHTRGTRIAGLIRYLYGPGRKEEHHNPRLVAAWDGAGDLAALEPTMRQDGRRDFSKLLGLLTDPIAAGFRPPRKVVWHCSVRLAPEDRMLSDAQWGHIAREMMAQSGLAPHSDLDAVRWVAIRHGDDHIHLAATLVRQDRRTEWARNDYLRCRAAAMDLEVRYGLRRTAPADRTGHRRAHPHELDKAARQHRAELPRERLRREVRAAAAAAASEADFVARLEAAGVRVRLRYSTVDPTRVTGYAVALPDQQTATGTPVWYGGGRLAADLTLPRLRARWGQADVGPDPAPSRLRSSRQRRAQVYRQAAETVRQAAADLAATATINPAAAAVLAYATADLLTATAAAVSGPGARMLTRTADVFDRAARDLHGRHPRTRVRRAGQLRGLGRLIAMLGRLSGNEDTVAAMQMVYALAAFADNLAQWRDAQQRRHQAQAARTAAGQLRAVGDRYGGEQLTLAVPLAPTPVPVVAVRPVPRRSR
jgi:hypothetical protein